MSVFQDMTLADFLDWIVEHMNQVPELDVHRRAIERCLALLKRDTSGLTADGLDTFSNDLLLNLCEVAGVFVDAMRDAHRAEDLRRHVMGRIAGMTPENRN